MSWVNGKRIDDDFAEARKEIRHWWGYLHTNGTIHLKRYHDDFGEAAMDDAEESDFVRDIWGPFQADNREEAFAILRKEFGR